MPFVLPRIFRPTVLEVYNLTNLELGTCFSVYGIAAMISYVLGGGIADRFLPGKLIGIALATTAAGGIVLLFQPSFLEICILYGYWGFTTIFLFWAAMIKATRVWGGDKLQGFAFGLLDGGRGFVSFLFGLVGVFIFSSLASDESVISLKMGYDQVILVCLSVIFLIGCISFFFLRVQNDNNTPIESSKNAIADYLCVLRIRNVWLLMLIVLCAYTGYKVTDVYSLYANQIMDYSQNEAASLGSNLLGIRIIIGVIAGVLADVSRPKRVMTIAFIIAMIGSVLFATGLATLDIVALFWSGILFTAVGTYALRALYFATLQESKIPLQVTGTAVGLISLIGYTPDVFMGPLMGYFLDTYPGIIGFQYVFGCLGLFCVIGMTCSALLRTK